MELPYSEPWKAKMIEPIYRSTLQERMEWIKSAKYNVFNLRSNQVYIDLLTDSGTGAMSAAQWAAMMMGDESYAGADSYYRLKKVINEFLGFPFFLPTHQGRAAENVLFSALVKPGDIVPGNAHFDTTKGHIEFRSATAVDCTIDEAMDLKSPFPFKGNVDLDKLVKVFESYPIEKIPFVILTLTCNTCGGQPVSMANIQAVAAMAKQYGIPLVIDGARFAENAWFIKSREDGYAHRPMNEIIGEMLAPADAMTMSSKKDAIVNIGGFIALRDEDLFRKATTFNILFEGFITYGGMAGRDMNALAQGLIEGAEESYLEARIKQVAYLGALLDNYGIPVQKPFGGHAIFIEALQFLTKVPKEEFVAQTLGIEIFKEAGVRGAEIGTLMADRDPGTRENRYPANEFLRLAIPRRVYSNNHMDVVATGLMNIWDRRNSICNGYRITREAPIMRHFTVELEPVKPS
jgi:tryptophanase